MTNFIIKFKENVFAINEKWVVVEKLRRINLLHRKDFSRADTAFFNQYFGRQWSDIIDTRFLWIFFAVILLMILNIIYLSNIDYEELQSQFTKRIREQYVITMQNIYDKSTISIKIDIPAPEISRSYDSNYITRKSMNTTIENLDRLASMEREISNTGILKVLAAEYDPYANLPDLPLIDADMVIGDIAVPTPSRNVLRERGVGSSNFDFSFSDFFVDGKFETYNIKLKRKGTASLMPTAEMLEKPVKKYGWRDSEEITLVMKKRERIIEYCFKRIAKDYSNLKGSVSVKFEILHTGIVDPSSVRIISSTLYNKKIEQCIKNALIRCRDFKKLDESMGIVAVKQKFIFN